MEEIIRTYFQAWLDADIRPIKEIFSPNAVYSECYGPEYRGLEQIIRWFEDWNKRGSVLDWRIKRLIEKDHTLIAAWYFRCVYDGTIDVFDGVTIS